MKEYLNNKHKKLILEEYILHNIKDYETIVGWCIIGLDIRTLVNETNRVEASFTFVSHQDRDFIGQNSYATKVLTLYIDNDELIFKHSMLTSDNSLLIELNTILKAFNRDNKLNKIL